MPTLNRKIKREEPTQYIKENKSAKYYNSKLWKNIRAIYIRYHPLCELCISNGISRPAVHVHHKKEFLSGSNDTERWRLLLDYDNLQSLCLDCHHKMHKHRRK